MQDRWNESLRIGREDFQRTQVLRPLRRTSGDAEDLHDGILAVVSGSLFAVEVVRLARILYRVVGDDCPTVTEPRH
jgi:hypothetical protein